MAGSKATRMFYGASYQNISDFGGPSQGGATQFVDGVYRKGQFVSDLSDLKARGARVLIKFPGPSNTQQDSEGNFSLAQWKLNMDACFNLNGSGAVARSALSQQMANFVADGTLMCNYMLDDFKDTGSVFSIEPNAAVIDQCAQYSKSVWPSVPCQARAEGQYFKRKALEIGQSGYSYIDYGWTQWSQRFGAPLTWFSNSIRDARAMGMGMLLGIDLLAGGSGDTAPWDVIYSHKSNLHGMSPQEIDACTAAASQLTMHLGSNVWSHQFDHTDYFHYNSISTALDRMANGLIGRNSGPINYRGTWFPPGSGLTSPSGGTSGSTDTSGSTQTVFGNWSYRGGGTYKTAGGASQPVSMPTVVNVGDLLCILGASRSNSQRFMGSISGWSTAYSISGNSLQGGTLTLQYKLATGSEGGQTVSVPWITPGGADTTGASCQVKAFAFSGNTNKIAELLSNAPTSSSSWAGGSSNMGPIKGLSSVDSDCMVMICGAKVKGVGSNPVTPGTMSATTSGGETWFRAFSEENLTGDDQFFFMDYSFLSGRPSVTTRSWTQILNADSTTSGSGCGFMLMFAPAIVSSNTGDPPRIDELQDVTFSLASTLNFRMGVVSGTAPITFSKNSAPSNMTLNSSTGAVQWTPQSAGTYFIILQATNSYGSDTESFFANVSSSGSSSGGTTIPNQAPVITHPGDMAVRVGEILTFTVTATDADGDVLTYDLDGAPAGVNFGSTDGAFVWTPTGEQGPADWPMVINVSDGQAISHSTFTVSVLENPWVRTAADSGTRFTRFRY